MDRQRMLRFRPNQVSGNNPFAHIGSYSHRQKQFKSFSDFEVRSQADMDDTDIVAPDLFQFVSQPPDGSLIPDPASPSPDPLQTGPKTHEPTTPPQSHNQLLGPPIIPQRPHRPTRPSAPQVQSSLSISKKRRAPRPSIEQQASTDRLVGPNPLLLPQAASTQQNHPTKWSALTQWQDSDVEEAEPSTSRVADHGPWDLRTPPPSERPTRLVSSDEDQSMRHSSIPPVKRSTSKSQPIPLKIKPTKIVTPEQSTSNLPATTEDTPRASQKARQELASTSHSSRNAHVPSNFSASLPVMTSSMEERQVLYVDGKSMFFEDYQHKQTINNPPR